VAGFSASTICSADGMPVVKLISLFSVANIDSCGAPRAGPHFGCVERDGPTFTFIYLIKSRLVVTIKRGSNYPLLMLPVFFFFLSCCIARNT